MRDFELLPRAKCEELFQAACQAARRAGVPDIEVMFAASDESLTRFANNEIHQNVAERTRSMSIRAVWNQRTARVTTNRLHRDGIQSAVDEVIALVKLSEPDADLLPLYSGSEPAPEVDRYSEEVANASPAYRARRVKEAIGIVEAKGQTAAGIYSTAESVDALVNSTGLFRYYGETQTVFSITATAQDSSGWAKASEVEFANAETVTSLARKAADKAATSANLVPSTPGGIPSSWNLPLCWIWSVRSSTISAGRRLPIRRVFCPIDSEPRSSEPTSTSRTMSGVRFRSALHSTARAFRVSRWCWSRTALPRKSPIRARQR